jgi:hypothetical protein
MVQWRFLFHFKIKVEVNNEDKIKLQKNSRHYPSLRNNGDNCNFQMNSIVRISGENMLEKFISKMGKRKCDFHF